MITDKQTRFSDAQAFTTGTQVSTNAYDLGLARDVGRGNELRVVATIDTTFTGGTSLQVQVIESASSNLSSPTVLASGAVIAEAAALAGTKALDVVLPTTSKRYLGIQVVTVGTHGAGALTAGIVMNSDSGDSFAAVTGF